MKEKIPYRIIIIGGNHINTLSVIRCLGECKCDIHVLLHDDRPTGKLSCANSRFSYNKTSVVSKKADDIYNWLIENKTVEKQILFPCSDFAALVIDEYYDELIRSYFVPGFINHPKYVTELMNKWKQKEFADYNGINMSNSWLITSEADIIKNKNKIVLPCIIKPAKSALGSKTDITVCDNIEEFSVVINKLLINNTHGLIVQEFIEKDNEYDVQGFISNNRSHCISNSFKKIFDINGNTVYAVSDNSNVISNINNRVVDALYNLGFRGIFDIEYIVSKNTVYLIEINFRHSGVGFGLIKNKVYLPYLWCLSVCGLDGSMNSCKQIVENGRFIMDETVCFNHRHEFGISVFDWLKMSLNNCSFAKFDIRDLRGTFFLYKEIILR